MSHAIRGCLLLVVMGAIAPNPSEAQLFRNPFNHCCTKCRRPPTQCSCTAMKPVVETQYRQQQYTTYHDVQQTEYRQQAYYETVPVTAYQNVVVDEGTYQKVWVPKMVTKQVPTTIHQQRLSYRTVPYQVNRRVAQVQTRLVPQQTVRYVPQQTHFAMNHSGYTTYGSVAPLNAAIWPSTTTAALPPLVTSPPVMASSIPTMPALTVPSVQTAQRPTATARGLVPDPKFASPSSNNDYDEWTTVERRGSSNTAANDGRLGGYRVAAPRENRLPIRSAQRSGKFVPAPSAASVWQSRRSTTRR